MVFCFRESLPDWNNDTVFTPHEPNDEVSIFSTEAGHGLFNLENKVISNNFYSILALYRVAIKKTSSLLISLFRKGKYSRKWDRDQKWALLSCIALGSCFTNKIQISIFIFGFLPSVLIHLDPTQGNFSYFHRSLGTLVLFSVFWDDVYLWIMICRILCQGRPITFLGVQRQTSAAWLNSLECMVDPRVLSNHLATTGWECLIGEEMCKKLPWVCCKTWFLMKRP